MQVNCSFFLELVLYQLPVSNVHVHPTDSFPCHIQIHTHQQGLQLYKTNQSTNLQGYQMLYVPPTKRSPWAIFDKECSVCNDNIVL